MEEYNIFITDKAITDLDNIADFISQNDERRSVHVYDEIVSRINTLKMLPRRYPYLQNEKLHEMGYRGMFVFAYLVVYWIDDETRTIEIHRIMPARFGLDNLQKLI